MEHIISIDSRGNKLNGGKNYKLTLSADIPAKSFWSVIVYDTDTRMMIHTDQLWPSVFSSCKKLKIKNDRSIDVYFGPKAVDVSNGNTIQTIPVKTWYMVLNIYEPLEAWFNKTWMPGEIEELK